MALREILIELGIEVNTRGAENAVGRVTQGLNRTGQASRGVDTALQDTSNRFAQFRNVALGLGAVFLTGKLAQGFGNMIEIAGEAAEVSSKFSAIFIEETDNLGVALDDLAVRTGQSRLAMEKMTADAGSLVKPMVGSTKAAAALAIQMTETALDISSFEDVSAEDALDSLRSALVGSTKPMLKFGVNTKLANLDQFALQKGLGKSFKALDKATQATTRMAFIMEELGKKGAVGDAEKTAGSFSNRLRGLKGAFEKLQAEVGKEFLPLATKVVNVLTKLTRTAAPALIKIANKLITVFKALASTAKFLISVFDGLTSSIEVVAGIALVALLIAINKVGLAAVIAGVKVAAAWIVAAAPAIAFALLMGIIIAAVVLLIDDFNKMGEGAESVTGTIVQGFMDLVDTLGGIGPALNEMFTTAIDFWFRLFADVLGVSKETIDKIVNIFSVGWAQMVKGMDVLFEVFFGNRIEQLKSLGKVISNFFKDDVEVNANASGGSGASSSPAATALGALSSVAANGTAVPTPGGLASPAPIQSLPQVINQPNTTNNVQVDATNQSNPEAIGDAVSSALNNALERRDRQAAQRFQTALASGG